MKSYFHSFTFGKASPVFQGIRKSNSIPVDIFVISNTEIVVPAFWFHHYVSEITSFY